VELTARLLRNAWSGWFIAFAGVDWQARIFWEFRLSERPLAEKEGRAFGGFDVASVEAVCAQTDGMVGFGRHDRIGHKSNSNCRRQPE
jgi:hypothetical protein